MSLNPFAMIAIIAYCAAIARLLLYRKGDARYRRNVSWIAWLFLVMLGGSAIDLLFHARLAGPFAAGQAVMIAIFVFGVRGNVARLLRSDDNG